jgi:hypothetical protein
MAARCWPVAPYNPDRQTRTIKRTESGERWQL